VATTWWNLGEMGFSPLDLPNDEGERLDNQIEVFGKTFSALTIGCARCHDHKFDPISAREYYGIFGMMKASPMRRAWSNEPEFQRAATTLRALRDQADVVNRSEVAGLKIDIPEIAPEGAKRMIDLTRGVPSDWMVTGHTESITEENAARRGLMPGLWSGTLSTRLPAMVRSPSFIIEEDNVHILAAGQDATIQIIIANHQTIREPIYDKLKTRVKHGNSSWLWHSFSIGRWKGLRAHVEIFTGTVEGTLRLLNTKDTPANQFGLRAVSFTSGKAPAVPPGACESGIPRLNAPAEIAAQITAAEKNVPAPERFLALAEIEGADVPIYARGDARKPREGTVPRRFLDVCGSAEPATSGSGRRELAEALLTPTNPLTSRVIVNRFWHHLFGRGLVGSVDNFGILGDMPTHPELLDFLAQRFVKQHRWSMKSMIREIVLARAWQLEEAPAPVADVENKLLSCFRLRRLEAEAIRDSIFAVSGTLDRTFGGPSIFVPHKMKGMLTNAIEPPSGPIDGARRRSIYLSAWRNFPSTFMDLFDKPPQMNSFGKRDVSNVPAQALTLLNDPFIAEQAAVWAERMRKSVLAHEQRVVHMYREAFSRAPTADELRRALELVGDDPKGWDDLALSLFNVKEFIYVR